MKKRLNDTQKQENKYKKAKIIGVIAFLTFGLTFGLVYLALNKWNFVAFITNPTTILVTLIMIASAVFVLSTIKVK